MIFITGATGLVGSHIAYNLLMQGEKLVAMKRENSDTGILDRHFDQYGGDRSLLNNIRWFNGDLLDVISLSEEMRDCDTVIHSAAFVSFTPRDRNKMNTYNIEGTANVVNAALDTGIEKFGYVSSTAAIGRDNKTEEVTEETKWKPDKTTSNYAVSKHYAEREVWRGMEEGLRVYVVNPCIVTGPGKWEASSAKMFSAAYKGLRFYTEGSNAFVDVRDVVKGLLGLMKHDLYGKRYLVIGENMSYREYFELVCEKLGVPAPHIKASRIPAEVAWRLEHLRSFLTGSRPLVTKETVRSARSKVRYSSKRIKEALPDLEFGSIEEAVENTADRFLREHRQ